MKKLVSLLLALLLTAALPMSAMAGAVLESSTAMEHSLSLGRTSNHYTIYPDGSYYLCDLNGNRLTPGYRSILFQAGNTFATYENGPEANNEGVLDALTGNVVIPSIYGDTSIISPDWILGIHWIPTTDESSDYKFRTGERFNIDYVDVYFKGQKVTTMTDSEYRGSYVVAHGDFLGVRFENNSTAMWIDAKGNRTPVSAEGYVSIAEFSDIYREGIFHNPTQQFAFTAGCTLTADQVTCPVWYTEDGDFVDLQGNVISKASSPNKEYSSVAYHGGDYMLIKANYKNGIVDMQGNEILPAIYAKMGGESNTASFFAIGYQVVMDADGTLSYLDKTGKVVSSANLASSESDYKGFYYNAPIIAVKNADSVSIITATKGLLAETYEDVSVINSARQQIHRREEERPVGLHRHERQHRCSLHPLLQSGHLPRRHRCYRLRKG